MRDLIARVTSRRLTTVRILVALAGLSAVLLWASSSWAQAPIPHAALAIQGEVGEFQDCLACHQAGVNGAPRVAADHAGRRNEDCLLCHEFTGAPPTLIPHGLEGREDCRGCHEAGVGGVPPLAGPHVAYTNEQCLDCHGVAPALPTATAMPPTPTSTPSAAEGPPADGLAPSACLDCHQSIAMDMRHAEIAGQPKGDVAVGQLLYADNCAMCHGENGELAVETAAGEGIVINSAEYLSQQDDAAVIVKIAVGVPGRMPAYGPDDGGPLSWAEVRSVAAFMRSWAPQAIPVPSPAPTGGDVAQGATLYADNCAACHGSEGQGGAVASQPINSPKYLAGVTDDGLDQVVRNGTAGMPSFGSRLSDEEIAALIAFMRSWANPPV